jgi:hypothetical protein
VVERNEPKKRLTPVSDNYWWAFDVIAKGKPLATMTQAIAMQIGKQFVSSNLLNPQNDVTRQILNFTMLAKFWFG